MTEDYHDRLDQIHRCVNALGGHETDDYDRGANDMVCDALVIIGWFGGMDPGERKARAKDPESQQTAKEGSHMSITKNVPSPSADMMFGEYCLKCGSRHFIGNPCLGETPSPSGVLVSCEPVDAPFCVLCLQRDLATARQQLTEADAQLRQVTTELNSLRMRREYELGLNEHRFGIEGTW